MGLTLHEIMAHRIGVWSWPAILLPMVCTSLAILISSSDILRWLDDVGDQSQGLSSQRFL